MSSGRVQLGWKKNLDNLATGRFLLFVFPSTQKTKEGRLQMGSRKFNVNVQADLRRAAKRTTDARPLKDAMLVMFRGSFPCCFPRCGVNGWQLHSGMGPMSSCFPHQAIGLIALPGVIGRFESPDKK